MICKTFWNCNTIKKKSKLRIFLEFKNSIIVEPKYKSVPAGGSVEFTCITDLETNWYHNDNKNLPKNVKTIMDGQKKILLISRATKKNSGIYSCFSFGGIIDRQNYDLSELNVGVLDVGNKKKYCMYLSFDLFYFSY